MEALISAGVALVATESVKELIKNSIGTYIKPKLEKSYRNKEEESHLIKVEDYIKDYLERSYKNAEIMNTIVFKNQQKKVDDLYIPLTLVKSDSMYKNKNEEIYIDKYKENLIDDYKKVLLVDSAGMGKSTIIKYLYLCTIRENKGIPVLIELRKLEKNVSIIEFIIKEINGVRQYLKEEDILNLIEGGDFIFFFDGYDEITQESKRDVTNNLQEFISKNSNNLFVISSRDENELNCFGDFQRFDIKSLTTKEAYELIGKYDNYGELSNELIEKLKTEDNLKIIKEFLENPLMTSLLYKAFEYKKTIPYKKHIFYRQVYDALFEEHDLSKAGAYKRKKESNLDIEDFHSILRTIGFITLNKGIIYSKEEFIKIVRQAKQKNMGIDFNEGKFIRDLISAVPIFIKEGNEYRWAHKSFQEYFAASYIYNDCKVTYEEILKKLVLKDNIAKYYNILDFYYDIDYKGFERYILYPIAKDYINYYENVYTNKIYEDYGEDEIDLRKAIQYSYKKILIKKLDDNERKEVREKGIPDFNNHFKLDFIPNLTATRNNKITIFYQYDDIRKIRRLLNNKKSKLVKNAKALQEDRAKIVDSFCENVDTKLYHINDNFENSINSKNIFSLATDAVIGISINDREERNLIFDYKECLNLKKKVEDELEIEKDDIYFI